MSKISNQIIDEASKWTSHEGVEGVAEGEKGGQPCIIVMASNDPSKLSKALPSSFRGYPVVIKRTGEIEVQ